MEGRARYACCHLDFNSCTRVSGFHPESNARMCLHACAGHACAGHACAGHACAQSISFLGSIFEVLLSNRRDEEDDPCYRRFWGQGLRCGSRSLISGPGYPPQEPINPNFTSLPESGVA